MRKLTKVVRNRDVYHPTSVATQEWIRWSQKHTDKIVMFSEWMDMPYEDSDLDTKELK